MGAAVGSGGTGAGSTNTSPQSAQGTVPSGMQSQLSGMLGRAQNSQMSPPPALRQPTQGTTLVPALDRFTTPSSTGMSQQQQAYQRVFGAEGQGLLNQGINANVQRLMGNPNAMVDLANQTQTSRADLERAMGSGDLYTYMNRPNYKQYGPNGQFYQPIYRPSYAGYPSPSQRYSPGYGAFGGYGGMPMMGNPFQVPDYMFAEGGEVDSEDEGIAGILKR